MHHSKYGRGLANCLARSLSAGLSCGFKKKIQISGFLLTGVLSLAGTAQQMQQNAQDCADPLMASSAACAGQGGQQEPGLSVGQNPLAGQTSAQPNVPGSYSDLDNYYRQRNLQQQNVIAPPEPLTEFQKFIGSTIGQVLPIYGASLFRRVPSTFAPLDMTPVPSNYTIGPGDQLRIRVWGQVSFEDNLRVDRSGDIFLPHVGPVHVAGVAYSSLDSHLRSAIARVYRNFDLTVNIGQIRAIQVYVAGQGRHPGVYTVSSLSTLVDALFASGGPSAQGSLRHIELRRDGALVTTIDLYDLLTRGDKSKDVQLANGDVIFIPPVGPQVAVTGSIRNAAIYELRANEPLSDLISEAGGATAVAAGTRVSLERIEDHRDRHTMEVAYDKSGLATPLVDGDLIRIYSILPSYQKTVTLRGNIANPGRFAWHAGMKVSELVPDKESLITRDYWWKRAQLGLPAPEFEPSAGLSNLRQPSEVKTLPRTIEANQQSQSGDQSGYLQNPMGYPVAKDGYPISSEGYPVDNPQLVNQLGGQQQDLMGQQLALEQANQGPRAGSSALAAEQTNAAAKFGPGVQRTQVRILAPDIDWNYAVIERLDLATLKTTLIPFDLGKLVLQHDGSQDLELQPGDVVNVFSEADVRLPLAQQTKLVKLEGEFVHGGTYSVKPGETLRQLVERAGGFTPGAYLFGSEFSRESARAIQQVRINEYVQNLETEIQRGSLAAAASATASAQDAAAAAAAKSSEQELLSRLRQIRATGRMVLGFKPNTAGLASIPDIQMEDGDRFVVPSMPASVNVIGAVYNQNSFLYGRSPRVGAYLRMAGGPNRSADSKHIFVIRADGEVISKAAASGPWKGDFNNTRLYPGDTIVVPDKTFNVSGARNFLNWTQTLSQLAIGGALIGNVMK